MMDLQELSRTASTSPVGGYLIGKKCNCDVEHKKREPTRSLARHGEPVAQPHPYWPVYLEDDGYLVATFADRRDAVEFVAARLERTVG